MSDFLKLDLFPRGSRQIVRMVLPWAIFAFRAFSFFTVVLILGLSVGVLFAEPSAERRALPPSDEAPEDWTRIPYHESRPEFEPTESEKQRGFALFSRPLVDAVYPESRPGAEERVEKLAFFAAGNQFQTLNFAVYPLQELPSLRVSAGEFRRIQTLDGEMDQDEWLFPPENVQLRLVTYRGIRYPQYSSKTKQYRVLPEYLQEVTVTDAPAKEPQRYFLTFKVPSKMKPGIYAGKVRISWGRDGAEMRSAELPVELKVLGFDLLRDPAKHYSAYYYPPKTSDGQWDRERMEREFAAMRDYGFTRSPVYQMRFDGDGKRFYFPELDFWLELMRKNGMAGPIPTIGGGCSWIASYYYGGKFGKHIRVLTPPKEEFYTELARMCRELKKDVDALPEGTPEMIFGPLDEIAPESTEFGTRVYQAFHDAGLPTYTTKEPHDLSFPKYDHVVDIFASQVFAPSYAETVGRHKREYWCYPNHNSYERKDMVIMCKGGRMTYGFGMWRSGFDLLIPWIWRAGSPDHFDLETSSGGNLLHPETGEVIMTTYWECFREGISDLRYLYTLQNAVIQREGTQNAALNAEIARSRALLQEIWDSIVVKEKYLNRHLWESERFDAYRTRIAERIEALYRFSPVNKKTAPSVIIEPREIEWVDPFQAEFARRDTDGTIQSLPIPLERCIASEDEAKVEIVEGTDVPAGARNDRCVLLTVTVDKERDGSSAKGPYPSNWPALAGYVTKAEWETRGNVKPRGLLMRVYVDSNRTVNAGKTPIHAGVQPGGFSYTTPSELEERVWHTLFVPLENAGYDGMPPVSGLPQSVRLTISEGNHEHGDVLKLYFDEISFIW